MPCFTNEPKNLDPEEKVKRDEAIKITEKCLQDVAKLGYSIHTAYSHQNAFFIDKQ